ncbi:receptor-type tyrosine-protein phosphatase T isoform X2 [Nematostella vectensis]|uniref:receptor-type tyrosine-protein phosphatase T isoform X2 n=1 Tax=Nematostella vectensis TaxID=45351 RepID=UPI002077517D|nr:receptor-type tyrosine-protein phosphatase T isoform X2 [Nematostella vectensis]
MGKEWRGRTLTPLPLSDDGRQWARNGEVLSGNTDGNGLRVNWFAQAKETRFVRIYPETWSVGVCVRVELLGCVSCASQAIGVSSNKIPDSSLTASSQYDGTTPPSKGRLYSPGGSWCASSSDSAPYLQVDMGSRHVICGVATQGDASADQWVQTYKLNGSISGSSWLSYRENTLNKVFDGNYDRDSVVQSTLDEGDVMRYVRVSPVTHQGNRVCLRTEVYAVPQDTVCARSSVGVSGTLPDHRFTASSEYDVRYKAPRGRLGGYLGWAPKTTGGGEWLQIDLGCVKFVCAVATQGNSEPNEYTTGYKLSFSVDNRGWAEYHENGAAKTFTGNTDQNTIVTNTLSNPTRAKLVKFYPTLYQNHPVLRVEVFGIASACSSPLGFETGGLSIDSHMTSSSKVDDSHGPSAGRLYGGLSWCSATSSSSQYLQVDLGRVTKITGIATQGSPTEDKWVTQYSLKYTLGGSLWLSYKTEQNQEKILPANTNKDDPVVNWLSLPFVAWSVRIFPLAWNTAVCMRIELFGCREFPVPRIQLSPSSLNLTATPGQSRDLICKVTGQPVPRQITWFANESDVNHLSSGVTQQGNTLTTTLLFNYTSAEHVLDTYSCSRPASGTGPVPCTSPPYACAAVYQGLVVFGYARATTVVMVTLNYPTRLAEPVASKLTTSSATITWNQPPLGQGQGIVTSYELHYGNASFSQSETLQGSSRSHVISGLQVYSNYSAKIRAISRVGIGAWSEYLKFTTDSSLPGGAPSLVSVVAMTSKSMQVTWKRPSLINGPLLGYKISYTRLPIMEWAEKTLPGPVTSDVIDGLAKWSSYKVQVRVYNDKGDGPLSNELIVRTKEDAPSQPPGSVKVIATSSKSVRISWSLPPLDSIHGIVRSFLIVYNRTDRSAHYSQRITGNSTLFASFDSLAIYTEYSFQVLAVTVADGPLSSPETVRTAPDAPTAPQNLLLSVTGPTCPTPPRVTLQWDPPAEINDARIKYYTVTHRNAEQPAAKTVNVTMTSYPITVMGGVRYAFSVVAVTVLPGPSTPTKAVDVPVYAPCCSPSSVLTLELNATTFQLSWPEIPRSCSNGPITSYKVRLTLVKQGRQVRTVRGISSEIVRVVPGSQTSVIVSGLHACAEYSISVRGNTSAGGGPFSSPTALQTSPPGAPRSLKLISADKREVCLKWVMPTDEKVEKYYISYSGLKTYDPSFSVSKRAEFNGPSVSGCVQGLTPGTVYGLTVSAKTACGHGPESSRVAASTDIDAPPQPSVPQIQEVVSSDGAPNITLIPSSDINGQISIYEIIVHQSGSDLPDDFAQLLTNFTRAKSQGLQFYVTANLKEISEPAMNFTVGDAKMYGDYRNVPLEGGLDYNVYIRAIAESPSKSMAGDPYKVAKISVLVAGAGTQEPSREGKGGVVAMAVGVVVGLLVVMAALLVGIFIWRRRIPNKGQENRAGKSEEDGVTMSNLSEANKSFTPSDEEFAESGTPVVVKPEDNGNIEEPLYENTEGQPRPVPISQFSDHVHRLKAKGRFKEEFQTLPSGQQFTWEVARRRDNKKRNRYANIIAYDHSRVRLRDNQESDYINASYLHGYDGTPRAYIASQGPLPVTVADFWQLVWQEQVTTIVMLTNIVEVGKTKCHRYWPEGKARHGEFDISLHREEVFADYVVRTFIIKKDEGQSRQVVQFQYTSWPDKGVPRHATSVLGFRRKVRAHYTSRNGQVPMLVHCSAGVGRTGAFIAIDAMLERAKKEKTVDIHNYVNVMRNNRCTMIQTEDQYAFVHFAVLEALTCGNTEIEAGNLQIAMRKRAAVKPTQNLSGYALEYQRLLAVSSQIEDENSKVGRADYNIKKNRYPSVVPLDSSRVVLSVDGGDYINASFADAFRKRNAFILTQAPLEHTMAEFWHMICQYKIGTIVMLNNLQEDTLTYPQYWPSKGSETYDHLNVRLMSREKQGKLISRKLAIGQKGVEGEHEVVHIQHIEWPDKCAPVNHQSVLDLVSWVQLSQQQCGDKAIVVQCSNGVGRSGTFCAIYSLLERIKAEQVVDVFQTVKVLRLGRPGAVETLTQYIYCYQMVQRYLDSFSDYANFSEV